MQARPFSIVILLIICFCPGLLPGQSKLPHEFGEPVPLYPSAQPVDTRYTRDSVTVKFATNDSYDRVCAFYRQALAEAGWLILPAKSLGVINAEKLESGHEDIHLTLTETSAMQGDPSGFIIDLNYPGGRE